jgi:hypothetical protein
MDIHGEVGIYAHSLNASPRGYSWSLSIRRIDGKGDPEFAKHHKEQVSAEALREFLPTWNELQWKEVKKDPVFPLREFAAESPPYRVNIILKQSSTESSEEVVAQFRTVLGSSA